MKKHLVSPVIKEIAEEKRYVKICGYLPGTLSAGQKKIYISKDVLSVL